MTLHKLVKREPDIVGGTNLLKTENYRMDIQKSLLHARRKLLLKI